MTFCQELNQQALHRKDTFFERLQFHLLRNLEISIKNIHIACEDKTTKSYPFQIGITLASATLQTTNDEWANIEVKDDAKVIFKVKRKENDDVAQKAERVQILVRPNRSVIDLLEFECSISIRINQ